jgi:RNA polymerase sigma-70 factor (ECF subfamily)
MAALLDAHRSRVVRAAANILRDPAEAEDVAQDAFLKAFREIHRLREDGAFGGFVYRIAVRLCLDRLRARRTEPSDLDRPVSGQADEVATKVLVEELLQQLSPDMRATLVLREMEQLSYDEIAHALGVPVGTVRSRLNAARSRFRTLWLEATA